MAYTVSIAEIRQLPLHEKLQIMEALWDELRANADAVLMPDWQKQLLDGRWKSRIRGA